MKLKEQPDKNIKVHLKLRNVRIKIYQIIPSRVIPTIEKGRLEGTLNQGKSLWELTIFFTEEKRELLWAMYTGE